MARLQLDERDGVRIARWTAADVRLDEEMLVAFEQALNDLGDRTLVLHGERDTVLSDPFPAPPLRLIRARLERGRALAERLARSRTAAVLEGAARGVGAELVIACRQRVFGPAATLAFPQVGLGLPAIAGASWRLPPAIGLSDTLVALLTGETIDAARAASSQLARISERDPINHALSNPPPAPHPVLPWWLRLAESLRFTRRAIFASARRSLGASGEGSSPAAIHTLRLVELGREQGAGAAEAEARRILDELGGELMVGRLHRTRVLRRQTPASPPESVAELVDEGGSRRTPTSPTQPIEVVTPEALESRPSLLLDLRPTAPEPVAAAQATARWADVGPERVGLQVTGSGDHVLWEVVGEGALQDRLARVGARLQAHVLRSSGPHFYGSLLLGRWLRSALHLLEQGAALTLVDAACVEQGFPSGPIASCDLIGLGTVNRLLDELARAVDPALAPPPWLTELARKRPGREASLGFYRWARGQANLDRSVYHELPTPERRPIPALAERLRWPIIVEAAAAVQRGQVGPEGADAGAALALGYPAHRGGPLHELDALGPSAARARLADLLAYDESASTGLRQLPEQTTRYFPSW